MYFHEVQYFRRWWITLSMTLGSLGILVQLGLGLYQQLVLGKPWGDNPMSDTGLILIFMFVFVVIAGIFLLVMSLKMEIRIDREGIRFRMPPLFSREKRFRRDDIESWDVRKYNPIMDYGGWGIRVTLGRGKAYNIRGNRGLYLRLKSGKKVLLGTQETEKIKIAMQKLMNEEEVA